MDDEVMIVRIYLRETEHGLHKTLVQEILNILRDQQRVRQVVVFRGIAGLDESGEVHAADLLRLDVDLRRWSSSSSTSRASPRPPSDCWRRSFRLVP